MNTIDREILLAINRLHTPFWDNMMWFASGTLTWLPFYILLATLLIFKFKRNSVPMLILIGILILCSDQIASGLIKPLVQRLRPSHDPDLLSQLHFVNNYRGGLYGFVSSHAANVFALAFYLSFVASKKIPWLPYVLFPWALFVSLSRVYLGVHYLSDVIVPVIFTMPLAYIIARLYFFWIKPLAPDSIQL
ncbi:phosphatase PAP2 family protein [Pedobacter sp. CG_S7]|uniref:phosphatase PAP2 family protein n=1 Tax=Pedobacter sp. CG_S7 TaxID=3143930 RepID=UPI0033909655